MHFRFRWTIVLAAIVVFCGGCGQMQKVHPRESDLLFQQAWKLEDAGNKQGALDELKRVADQQTANPEAAAPRVSENSHKSVSPKPVPP